MSKKAPISADSLEKKTDDIKSAVEKIEKTDEKILEDFEKIVASLKATGLQEFMEYLKSPWRIIWSNFLAGIFRGLGILMGMSLVLGIAIWILGHFVNFPLVGKFFQELLMWLQTISPEKTF